MNLCWDNAVMKRDFLEVLRLKRLNYQNFATHHEGVENVESYIYFTTTKKD
jgi:hypothetical protein